ncbi:MAG: hypothetical protein OXI38_04055 [Bacteroidota bacterium]|nr:hypothetical protein [Bacteroidota bacterium]
MLERAFRLCLLASLCATASFAQTPMRGVVWSSDSTPTAADLHRIRQAGAQAIRLPLVHDRSLLIEADSLGLSLFQELPMRYLTASSLMDSLDSAASQLARALELGAGHASAAHYGLANYSDTSNEAACSYFTDLARMADVALNVQVYYVSPFIESDRCTHTVDFVLLDVRHLPDPSWALDRWPHPARVGVGALGTAVTEGAFGLRNLRSPQSQARYFELHLPTLLDAPVNAVFVYRWGDNGALHEADRWGLLDSLDQLRPAYEVVRGLYTGTQQEFAFPAGKAAQGETPWLVVVGWLAILALGLTYAVSISWRNLVHRFLTRHGFYLDSVRMGREFPGIGSLIFMLVQALITGCVCWLVVHTALESRAGEPMLASLSPAMLQIAGRIAGDPGRSTLLFSGVNLVFQMALLLAGMSVLSTRGLAGVKRVITLQVSAQWHVICLLPLIMVYPSFSQADLPLITGLTAGGWILAGVVSGVRLVVDYGSVLGPSRRIVALFVLMPQALSVTAALAWVMYTPTGASIAYWWHLIVRP